MCIHVYPNKPLEREDKGDMVDCPLGGLGCAIVWVGGMLKSRGTLKKRINLTPSRSSGTVTLSVTTGGDG